MCIVLRRVSGRLFEAVSSDLFRGIYFRYSCSHAGSAFVLPLRFSPTACTIIYAYPSHSVSLYISLALLHAHGVEHGYLRAENLVVSPTGVPSLIDLSHARAHGCNGAGVCEELREGRALFGIG